MIPSKLSELKAQLGAVALEGPDGLLIAPVDARQLASALQVLASQQTSLGGRVKLSRAAFSQLGAIEPRSGTVECGVGLTLQNIEATLVKHQLSLGPLTPRAMALPLCDFLEGPWAGLRAIHGGRLEPICLSLEGLLPDGRVFRSHPSPRSAAGPELTALWLGAHGRLGLTTRATLRCVPLAAQRRPALYSFPDGESLVSALMAAIADGVLAAQARIEKRSGRIQLELVLEGSDEAIERDTNSLSLSAFAVGGRPAGRTSGEWAVDSGAAKQPVERECRWAAVRAAIEAGRAFSLFRLSLSSVIAAGDVEGMPLDVSSAWANGKELQAALDPAHLLGGTDAS